MIDSRAIKVVAFDLDDTLWDMRPTLLRAEQKLLLWLTDNCPRLDLDRVSMGKVRTDLLNADPGLAHRISELRRQVIAHSLVLSGYAHSEAESHAAAAFEVFLNARNQVFFFEGALEAIASLADHYTLGTLTNGNADIERLGLSRYFSFSFTAEQVGRPKPALDLFLAALNHTAVRPAQMAYVGDHPQLDIAPAHEAGLYTIWVNIKSRSFDGDVLPDAEIRHLRELPGAVDRLGLQPSA